MTRSKENVIQVRRVPVELQERQALLVHLEIQDLPVLLGSRDRQVRQVQRDYKEKQVHKDLLDQQAIQVCTVNLLLSRKRFRRLHYIVGISLRGLDFA